MAEFENLEEQRDEVEALESIYMEDFVKLSDEPPLRYAIGLVPNPGEADGENHVRVTLECTIPAAYPNVGPEMRVAVDKGLSPKQADELLALANAQADENVGMPMMFTVGEALKEWLVEHNRPGQGDGSMYADMMRRMEEDKRKKAAQEAAESKPAARGGGDDGEGGGSTRTAEEEEAEEKRRLERLATGTPVNAETFAEWWAKFSAERQAEQAACDPGAAASSAAAMQRPSGKDIFLSGKAVEAPEVDEAEEDAAAAAEGEAGVDAPFDTELFEGDDEDLDDLDDLDDDDDDEGGGDGDS